MQHDGRLPVCPGRSARRNTLCMRSTEFPIESDVDVRALIDVDTIKYRAETDNRIVRKKHVYSVLAKCTGRARKDQLFPNVAGCSEKRFGNYAGALK